MSSKEDPEFNKITGRWEYEDEAGHTWEQDSTTGLWTEVIGEEQLKQQQAAYSVPGVDESAPAVAPRKKRKLQETFTSADAKDSENDQTSAKKDQPEQKVRQTAVYVQNLPLDTSIEELAPLFSKCGLLSEDLTTRQPRIKLYTDEHGKQKGDALVIYFREESVGLAIEMLDGTSVRGDKQMMSVTKASFSHKAAKTGATDKRPKDEASKKVASHRAGKLKSKLTDWSDEEEDRYVSSRPNKNDKVVILKRMFTLDGLESDPTLLLDLKEDVREECGRLGQVTNVVLYDKEPSGVMSVRFKDADDAAACIELMNGRFFAGRQVIATLHDGRTTYSKSGKGDVGDEDEEEARLAKFGSWLEDDTNK